VVRLLRWHHTDHQTDWPLLVVVLHGDEGDHFPMTPRPELLQVADEVTSKEELEGIGPRRTTDAAGSVDGHLGSRRELDPTLGQQRLGL